MIYTAERSVVCRYCHTEYEFRAEIRSPVRVVGDVFAITWICPKCGAWNSQHAHIPRFIPPDEPVYIVTVAPEDDTYHSGWKALYVAPRWFAQEFITRLAEREGTPPHATLHWVPMDTIPPPKTIRDTGRASDILNALLEKYDGGIDDTTKPPTIKVKKGGGVAT